MAVAKELEIQHKSDDDIPYDQQLPEDLITEILLNLPVESLLVFKSARKSWHHLINTPYFVETHLHHPSAKSKAKSSKLVIRDTYYTDYWCFPTFYIIGNEFMFFASSVPPSRLNKRKNKNSPYIWKCSSQPCGGLLCFTANVFHGVDFLVVNPATLEFRELPKLDLQGLIDFIIGQSTYMVYDHSSRSYKILWVSYTTNREVINDRRNVYVIDLVRDLSWRKLDLPYLETERASYISCLFPSSCHGMPHWFPYSERGWPYWFPNLQLGVPKNQLKIHVFDPQRENFMTFNFMLESSETSFSCPSDQAWQVVAFQGSIYIFFGCKKLCSSHELIHVRSMKDFMNGGDKVWIKENDIKLRSRQEEKTYWWSIPTIVEDGIVIERKSFNIKTGLRNAFYEIYNPDKKVLRRYRYMAADQLENVEQYAIQPGDFVESLVSPKRGY